MKKGLVGMIILGVFVFLLVAGIGAGIYFYNYYVFKEVRICIGEGVESPMPCDARQDCVDFMVEQGADFSALDGAPEFVRVKVNEVLERSIYCEGNCFIRKIRGIDFTSGELEILTSCEVGEDEVVIEVRGKEGIEVLEWMKAQSG